ncbi:MAG: immunoglobulin domain-containing protein, partial [Prosthecobacter sp.]
MRDTTPSFCLRLAGLFAFGLATTTLATDPALDSAFTATISPGITPNAYPSFASGTGAVNAVALQSDGKILIGGNVSRYKAPASGSPQTSLKRLNADGTLDTAFEALASTLAVPAGQTEINSILVTASDKIYVGGIFETYEGAPRSGFMRLNANGSLDTSFNMEGVSNTDPYGNRYVMSIAEQPDGKVLVGGAFNRITTPAGTMYVPNLGRLNSDGSLDSSFNQINAMLNVAAVDDIAVLPNRQILVAGRMYRAGGGVTPLLRRLNEDGSLDASFSVNWSSDYGNINELLVLPDGRIVIGGDFQFAGASTHSWVACLNANGTIDTTFMTNLGSGPNGQVGGELALQPDGTILAGGTFFSWNGQPRASIARLLPDGTLDNALNVQPFSMVHGVYTNHVYSLAVQPDGKIVMGGWFGRVTDPAVETINLARIMNEHDATGAGTLRMVSAAARTTERESSITLPVSRFGGLNGAVSVAYSITAGNAVAGTDYTAVSGTLNWAAGEGGLKNIVVPILPDAVADGSRTFTVKLASPTGGATLPAANESTVVTIWDDEAAPTIVSSPQSTSLEQGGSFTLRVGYESVLAAEVQWQLDTGSGFSNIPAATSLTYTVNVADPLEHAGTYRAIVMNANGDSFSDPAVVTISVPAGSLVTTFVPPAGTQGAVSQNSIGMDASGRHLILSGSGLRRMNADGTLESTTTFGVDVSGATQLLVLPNGKILMGGNMFAVTHLPSNTTPATGSRIIRINNDATGTIDAAYQPTIPGVNVFTLAASTNGSYYVGSSVNTGTVSLLRFLENGTQDSSFVSALPQTAAVSVYAIKEQPDGKVLVSYTHGLNASISYRLARLTSTGALDTTFGTGGTATFATFSTSLELLPDGRIVYTGQNLTTINGQQTWLALLSPTGVPDNGFLAGGVLNNKALGTLYRDGRLMVWGNFTTVNGVAQRGLARLNLDGTVDTTYSAGVGAGGGDVIDAQYTATGELFIAGSFTSFKGVARNKAALLVANPHIGALGFNPVSVNVVEDNAPLSLTLRRYGPSAGAVSVDYATVDGTALGGTDFNSASGTVSWADGDSTDKTITLNLLDNATVEATRTFRVALSNASGPAGPAAGVTVNLIDDDAPVSITTQPVASTALYDTQALALSVTATSPSPAAYQWYLNGIAISGATSATYNVASVNGGTSGVYHVRITNAAGTYLSTPSLVSVRRQPGRLAGNQVLGGRPTFSGGSPFAMAALNDGGVLVGGAFSQNAAANVPQYYLTRVKANGTTDTSFILPLNNTVTCMLRQPDGKILVGGLFTAVTDFPAITAKYLIRLNSDLTLDTAFNSAVATHFSTTSLADLALQPDGAILVAMGSGVMRFTTAGALDTTFGTNGTALVTGNAPTALGVLSDGDIVVGGGFTNIAAASPTKNRLARLNSDGTPDYSFTSGLGGSAIINDILVLADERIFAAGSNFANGATLALVNADGTFGSNIASTSQVFQIAQAPGGKVVVTRTTSGTSSSRMFRLLGSNPLPIPGSADGDSTFNIGTGPDDGDARALTVGPDGSVWLAGQFTTFNGAATGSVVKLNGDPLDPDIVTQPATTGVPAGDTAFICVGAHGTNLTYQWYKNDLLLPDGGNISGATSAVLSISNMSALDEANYTVAVTGGPGSGTITSAAAHLYLLGAPVVHADPLPVSIYAGQNATLTAQVFALPTATYSWQRNGVPVTDGGRFSGATTASLTITGALAADSGSYVLTITNAQGQDVTVPAYVLVRPIPHERVPGFTTLAASLQVNAFYPLPDGRMVIAGTNGTNFSGGAGSTTANGTALAIVKPDGSYDTNLAFSAPSSISAITRQSDGKWLIGGTFSSVAGVTRNNIARLNANFTVDTTFNAGTGPNGTVSTVAVDSTGKIYIGGTFTQFNAAGGAGRAYFARLNADGTLDTTLTTSMAAAVTRILPLPTGGVLVGGSFFSPTSVIRLDASGALVAGFNGPSPGTVNDLALTPDGTGFYVAINNSSPYLRRYSVATGAQDATFSATGPNGAVFRIAVQPDGKVVAAGNFSNSPGFSPTRFLPSGALDTTFAASNAITSNQVMALAVAPSGRIWLGGSFNLTYGGASATRLLVLNGDLPALAFARQPVATEVEGGQTATFVAEAVSTSAVEYRWYKDDEIVTNGGRVSGANSATLSIANANVGDEGQYSVRATSLTEGTITSANAELVYLGAPEILTAPVGGTFDAGISKTLTVAARGAATLSYQWFRTSASLPAQDISGATSASYTLSTPATTDTYYYGVRITNGLGSVSSTPVLVSFAQYAGSPVALTLPAFNSALNRVIPLADGSFVATGQFTSITPPGGSSTPRRYIARILTDGSIDTNFTAVSTSSSVQDCVRDSQGRFVIVG